jgi:hypothetical protein
MAITSVFRRPMSTTSLRHEEGAAWRVKIRALNTPLVDLPFAFNDRGQILKHGGQASPQ